MERIDELTLWDAPPYVASAVPIVWELNHATGERLVAVVALRYESPSPRTISAHIAFEPNQLRAMIGHKRATSALGILEHVSLFVRTQLGDGIDLVDLQTPFDGFIVGKPTRVRGYSEKQVVDSAIRTLSTFGTRGSFNDAADEVRRNSAPTSQFLRSLRSAFAQHDSGRKGRFNHRVQWPGAPEMTIDYAHERHLVQVTSLPQSPSHLITLQKEAESKMLELDVAASLLRQDHANAQPYLLINVAPISQPMTVESKKIATELLDRLRFISSQKDMSVITANSPEEGASLLEDLPRHSSFAPHPWRIPMSA
ncbi:hypothetical protein [Burkholderia cepacia]|uniref:hypothetical protein n=1 Tax=Burkholderia cepacia TaxID=292 RepID=UPI000AFD1BC2|nr:hypothetical protein [Burkholderia cepacia]MCE4130501.1 hypothetical protein [Burkholderia cepacia]MDN7612157.1 hypothetical protein [Burkholderia cepacia]